MSNINLKRIYWTLGEATTCESLVMPSAEVKKTSKFAASKKLPKTNIYTH